MEAGNPKDIAALAAELTAANHEYVAMKKEESFVRSRATEALNKLNQAQKAFDVGISAIRDAAPHDSDWKHETRHRAIGSSIAA